jgi:cytochrome b involved in lipid metabolism
MRTWFLERNGYLVGDSYSFLPGWMEGALESIDALFQQKGGKKMEKYTLQEVSKHNTREDGWMVIRGRVYDVTDWIPLHPGGDAILAGLGKDATTLFENVHPNLMLPEKMLKRYYIGDVRKN